MLPKFSFSFGINKTTVVEPGKWGIEPVFAKTVGKLPESRDIAVGQTFASLINQNEDPDFASIVEHARFFLGGVMISCTSDKQINSMIRAFRLLTREDSTVPNSIDTIRK